MSNPRKSPRFALHPFVPENTNEPATKNDVASTSLTGGMLGKRDNTGDLITRKWLKGEIKNVACTSSRLDADDDFVGPIPKSVIPIGEKLNLGGRSRKGEIKSEEEYIHKIRTRSSPKSLCEALKKLSAEQKECVRQMGFGKMLSFSVDGIPGSLGHYVVDKLDSVTMAINLERGSIKITKEAIYQLIGVPNGGVCMSAIDDKKADKAISKLWRANYRTPEVSPNDIANRLGTYTEAGWMFRIDFVMLFISTMIDCQKNGKCRMCLINYFTEERDISDLDWCSLIHSKISVCKNDWIRDDPDCYFTGPLTILTLFYVGSTPCNGLLMKGEKLVLAAWDMKKLKQRQKAELEGGGFGKGEIGQMFAECVESNAQVTKEKVENKYTPDPLMVIVSKLNDLIASMSRNKLEFEMSMKEGLGGNPQNEDLINLSSMYEKLFGKHGGGTTTEVNNKDASVKGKEIMVVTEEPLSQFWNDATVLETVCNSVDIEAQKYYQKGVGSSCGPSEPSFSLGLTQEVGAADFITPVRIPENNIENEEDDHVPLSVIMRRLSNEGIGRAKSKRITRLSNLLKSPFRNRPVDINKPEAKEEAHVWEYLWRISGEQFEVIFSTIGGRIGVRGLFESLQPQHMVHGNVIECWSVVLNHEEAARGPDSDHRLFCGCTVLQYERNVGFKSLPDHVGVARIRRNIDRIVNGDVALMKLATYDLVFFPIQLLMHYFVICFDLKNPSIVILDSIDMQPKKRLTQAERDLDDQHVHDMNLTVSKVKQHFGIYLKEVGHVKTNAIIAQTPKWLRLKWATYGNYEDSGIYMMRHMEMYKGKKSRNLECGFAVGAAKQKQQLISLRKKYAAKILLSDINVMRGEIAKVIAAEGSVV